MGGLQRALRESPIAIVLPGLGGNAHIPAEREAEPDSKWPWEHRRRHRLFGPHCDNSWARESWCTAFRPRSCHSVFSALGPSRPRPCRRSERVFPLRSHRQLAPRPHRRGSRGALPGRSSSCCSRLAYELAALHVCAERLGCVGDELWAMRLGAFTQRRIVGGASEQVDRDDHSQRAGIAYEGGCRRTGAPST